MNAHLEIIDQAKDVERLGCEELRAGLAAFLSTDARRRAEKWQAEGKCGMVGDNDGFIFSCDLENDPQGLAAPPNDDPGARSGADGRRVVSWEAASTFVGTVHRATFGDCCTNGKEIPTQYAYLLLGQPIDIRATPGDEIEAAKSDVMRLQLGSSKAGTAPPDGAHVAVTCQSLWAGITGHYALPVYCNEPTYAPSPRKR